MPAEIQSTAVTRCDVQTLSGCWETSAPLHLHHTSTRHMSINTQRVMTSSHRVMMSTQWWVNDKCKHWQVLHKWDKQVTDSRYHTGEREWDDQVTDRWERVGWAGTIQVRESGMSR